MIFLLNQNSFLLSDFNNFFNDSEIHVTREYPTLENLPASSHPIPDLALVSFIFSFGTRMLHKRGLMSPDCSLLNMVLAV